MQFITTLLFILRSVSVLIGMIVFAPEAGAVTELPKLLQQGLPLRGISAARGEGIVFRIVVPENARSLSVKTSGGTGDCDLYVRHGAHPTSNNFDETSDAIGNRETIEINQPEAGNWYVLALGTSAFKQVTLTARFKRGAASQPLPKLFPAPGTYPEQVAVKIPVRRAAMHPALYNRWLRSR